MTYELVLTAEELEKLEASKEWQVDCWVDDLHDGFIS